MSKEIATYGHIDKGRLMTTRSEQFAQALSTFPDGVQVEITVRVVGNPRSSPQNRWYHGVIIPLIRDAINDLAGDESHDSEAVHELLKRMFNAHDIVCEETGDTITLTKSTKGMDTYLFSDYCEKCRKWAYEFLNIQIPDPNREKSKQFNIGQAA